MAWATLRKTWFSAQLGFSGFAYADGKYHQHGNGRLYFSFVRIINVFWDPMVGTYVDKRTSKAGKYRPWLLRAGVPLVILSALLFAPIPGVKGSVAFAFIIYLALDLVYSLVNIPYGSLNASLTRDPESIDKLTSTRMMLANSANLLVYTLFPMFVQMAAPRSQPERHRLFGLELNLGNYTDPSANYAWFGVYAIYMIIGAVALFICYKCTKERVVATAEQTANVKTTDLFHELRHNRPLVILGMFFMLAFTFMFFMNTVNGFFNQFVVGHSEWMGAVGLVASIPGIAFPVFWPKLKKSLVKRLLPSVPRHVHRRRTADLRLVPRRDARRPVAGLHRHLY